MINKLLNLFRFKKSDRVDIQEVKEKLSNTIKPEEKPKIKKRIKFKKDGWYFKIGTRVICRSNECDPLMVGKIVEFWDNNGKFRDNPVPHVKCEITGEIYGVLGIIRPYTDELYEILKPMKPLEQWNYFVDDIHKYTEKDMERKEKIYEKFKSLKK